MSAFDGMWGALCVLFVGLGVAAIGGYQLYLVWRNRRRAAASQGWPATGGLIVQSEVQKEVSTDSEGDTTTSFIHRLEYEYRVGGQVYRSRQMAFGAAAAYPTAAKAGAAAGRFPPGAGVTVYYNPQRPDQAVLQRAATGQTALLTVGVIFLLSGLCMACVFTVWVVSLLIK